MKSLALRIYLAVVTVLLLFALSAGWLAQRNLEHERMRFQSQSANNDRMAAWAELLVNSLPGVKAPEPEQRQAVLEWSQRLRLPMAMDNEHGQRLVTTPLLTDRLAHWPDAQQRLHAVKLEDGRTLWLFRSGGNGPPRSGMMGPPPPGPRDEPWLSPLAWMLPPGWAGGAQGLAVMLVVVFVAVALGAWPVANRLTRRLQALRRGVERFGEGQLQHRVQVEGRDEVADLARSFNQAAQRIEDLVSAHRSLLANASHELRSPLARMKMAVSMLADMPPEKSTQLQQEIHEDIRELDALVEEVLLASRLDARPQLDRQRVDLWGVLAEEAQRTGARVQAAPGQGQLTVQADERLLRRAVRNLLENAQRYGRPAGADADGGVQVSVQQEGGMLAIVVEDRGPGVPESQRERIFEPFYRMPGHAEHAGGVGLGLSLVRQIAQRHGGSVRCEAREGGGSRFVITLPS